jgi:hypothetical protein
VFLVEASVVQQQPTALSGRKAAPQTTTTTTTIHYEHTDPHLRPSTRERQQLY